MSGQSILVVASIRSGMAAAPRPPRIAVYEDPRMEGTLRDRRVYLAFRRKEEMEKDPWFPGNIFQVKYRDELLGEAQVVLPEAVRLEDLTVYDAMVTGLKSVEELRSFVSGALRLDPDPKAGLIKILYRWL